MKNIFILLGLLFPFFAASQNQLFEIVDKPNGRAWHYVEGAAFFKVNIGNLNAFLNQAPNEFSGKKGNIIFLPTSSGDFLQMAIYQSPMMEVGLQEKFPTFKTFSLQGIDDASFSGRADITEKGFQAILHTTTETWYFDQAIQGSNQYIMVYSKNQFVKQHQANSKEQFCLFDQAASDLATESIIDLSTFENRRLTGNVLRNYRLAVASTGEYTAFHGGTVAAALSAIVTTINRVNSVYERDLAIRLNLIANNNLLIYTNAATDPFSNNNAGQILGQNQTNTNNVIGSNNYDIGHVFATGTSGLASFESVCNASRKAQAVTGISDPIGDPFDIDYVAHEIGHQFGANHSFNASGGSCGSNRNGSTAYEPGSGTTIMSYAGLCGNQNIQNNSNDYFHVTSLLEMYSFAYLRGGNSCANRVSTGNNPPIANAGQGGFVLPIGTPFKLVGAGTDPDGDALTYCWEQFDLGPAGAPNAPIGNAPLFRSFSPTPSPERVFPRFTTLINNQASLGEILPTTSRALNFRLTVRDNKIGGGGISIAPLALTTTATAGPFQITNPAPFEQLVAGSFYDVKWNVANTNVPPVNCQLVNIIISYNRGITFLDTLAVGVPNTGNATVRLPANKIGSFSRILVEAADHLFFDVSRTNFSVIAAPNPDFSAVIMQTNLIACSNDTLLVPIFLNGVGGFNDTISLSLTNVPVGVIASLSATKGLPGDTIFCAVSGNVPNGQFVLQLNAQNDTIVKNTTIAIFGSQASVASPNILSPLNGDFVSASQPIVWESVAGALLYQIDIFADSLLQQNVVSTTVTDTFYQASLQSATPYWLRIRAENNCGFGLFSTIISFNTTAISCFSQNNNSFFPISQVGLPVVRSNIQVTKEGFVQGVRIVNVTGAHAQVGELRFRLIGPDSTSAILMQGKCNNSRDFNLGFDDLANLTSPACPPVGGFLVRPEESLSRFNNKLAYGIWTLEVADLANMNGGSLTSWTLELCLLDCNNETVTITIPNQQNTYCFGDTVQLLSQTTASNNGVVRYAWHQNGQRLNGQNSNRLIFNAISQSTQITHYAFTACGIDSVQIPINVLPLPVSPNIIHNGNQLTASSGFVKYIWFFNNQALADSTQQIIAIAVGNYTVIGVDSLGCKSALSAAFIFDPTSINNVDNKNWKLFPNPAITSLNIYFEEANENTDIYIYDLNGKQIIHSIKDSANNTIEINISYLPSGMYLVKLINNKKTINAKFLKISL